MLANAPVGISELDAPSAALMLGFQTVFAVRAKRLANTGRWGGVWVCAAAAFVVAVIVRPPRAITIITTGA